MVFKIAPYRKAHEKSVKEMYLKDGVDSISFYCAVSFCPVIAAYWFCREVDPDNPELTRRIENARIFYSISEVEDEKS